MSFRTPGGRSTPRLVAAAVVVLLSLAAAGCAAPTNPAPTTTPDPTTTARPTNASIPVAGDLPVDADAVFARVERLHDVDVRSPERVRVRSMPVSYTGRTAGFAAVMGFRAPTEGVTQRTGGRYYPRNDTVVVYTTENSTRAEIEAVLAHEFAHVVQLRTTSFISAVNRGFEGGNGFQVRRSIAEGSATYAARAYADRYLDGDPQRALVTRTYRDGSPYVRLSVAPYRYGARYAAARVDSPASLPSLYADPPVTTEQVLHNLTPSAEPPAELYAVGRTDRNASWASVGDAVKGELYLREALTGRLNDSHAARAAAGWGADRLVTFRDAGTFVDRRAYAWVLRWDSPAEADEFEAAFRTYLDRRATRRDGRWLDGDTAFRLVPAGDDAVVVAAGPTEFVDAVGAEADGQFVAVTVEAEEATTESDGADDARRNESSAGGAP